MLEGAKSGQKCAFRLLTVRAFGFREFTGKLAVNFLAVIEVVGERGVNFSQREVRILEDDFLRRPSAIYVICGDLRDADAREAFQVGGFSIRGDDVWVIKCGHGRE